MKFVNDIWKKYGLASTCLQNYRTVPYRTWKYGVLYRTYVPYSCLIRIQAALAIRGSGIRGFDYSRT